MADNWAAYISSLTNPGAPLQQMDDIGAGARGWAAQREQKRANEANESMRYMENWTQQAELAEKQRQFDEVQGEKRHQEEVKAASDLMDAIATEDPDKIAVAKSKAALLGIDLVSEDEQPKSQLAGPIASPLDGATGEATNNVTGVIKGKGSIADVASGKESKEVPAEKVTLEEDQPEMVVDEYGGRLLDPGEKAQWAGDQKPPGWLQKDMAARGKPKQLGNPPGWLSDYMTGQGVSPLMAKAQPEEPTGKPVTPEQPPAKQVQPLPVTLDEETAPGPTMRQSMQQSAEYLGAQQPQTPPRQPVRGGYFLQKDGRNIGYVPHTDFKMRQREMAGEGLSPLLKNARNDVETHAATEAIAIGQQQADKIGVGEAMKAGQAVYDKILAEHGKNERAQMAAWSRAQQQDVSKGMRSNQAYEALIKRYDTGHKLAEVRTALQEAEASAEQMLSDNPAEQRVAAGKFAKAIAGGGVLSDFDMKNALNAGGKMNKLVQVFNDYANEGRYPERYQQLVAEAQQELRRAKGDYLRHVAVKAINEMQQHPDMYDENDLKSAYIYFTGTPVPAEVTAPPAPAVSVAHSTKTSQSSGRSYQKENMGF